MLLLLPPTQPTCVAAIRISPLLGVHRLFITPIKWYASARASSVCRWVGRDGRGSDEGSYTFLTHGEEVKRNRAAGS